MATKLKKIVMNLSTGKAKPVTMTKKEIVSMNEASQKALDKRASDAWLNGRKGVNNDGYLTIEDQLELIYLDMKNNTTEYVKHIDEVKDRYPKPATKKKAGK